MRRLRLLLPALALLLIILGSRSAAAQQNLLRNPGFEGAYSAWSGIPEIQMAAEWTPWWVENPEHNPPYFRPEFKRADGAAFPNRVYEGGAAQQYFTFHASHVAGFYQQVFGVTPGQRYQFSIYVQVWSSTGDDPYNSVAPANPRLHVGIDPTGNWNAGAATVVWSPEAPMNLVIDRWGRMTVEAVAQSDVITVMVRTRPDFPNKHNDTYWDAASLIAVGAPQPTETSVPPSPTPEPTADGGPPTVEPSPTATSQPGVAPTETPAGCEPPAGWIPYTVRRGDNLFRLALNTGSTVAELRQVNCLSSDSISVGEVLYLPQLPPTPELTATPAPTADGGPPTAEATSTVVATADSVPPTAEASPTLTMAATATTVTETPAPTEVAVAPEATEALIATVPLPAPTVPAEVDEGSTSSLGIDTTVLLAALIGVVILLLGALGLVVLRGR